MKIFFSDYPADEHVPPDEPREVSLKEAVAEFEALCDEEGCFFGLIDDRERVVQFMYNEDGRLLIDIPLAKKQGSLRRDSAAFEECRQIIVDSEAGVQIEAIPGLKFEPW